MRMLGHILMWGGFLATSLVAMRQSDRVDWTAYLATAAIGVVGVVLLRRTAGADAKQTHAIHSNLETLDTSIARIVEGVARMNAEKGDLNVYDVHGRIDADLAPDLATFADAREAMIHGLGLPAYAAVMDAFARGERFVNRAWSASADGYIDEVWKSMGIAEQMMREAQSQLQQHRAAAA